MVRIRQGPYECPSGSEDRACNADGIESGSSFAATEVRIRQGPSGSECLAALILHSLLEDAWK